jgi:hypothetical protein
MFITKKSSILFFGASGGGDAAITTRLGPPDGPGKPVVRWDETNGWYDNGYKIVCALWRPGPRQPARCLKIDTTSGISETTSW